MELPGTLHIVMHRFNFEMQFLLDSFISGKIDFKQLNEAYHQIGTEKSDIIQYKSLLENAQQSKKVKLHGGFLPHPYSELVTNKCLHSALEAAKQRDYVDPSETCTGTFAHYNYFESTITGRNIHEISMPM